MENKDKFRWSIVSGNLNETFSIRSESGSLQLAKPIENLPLNVQEIVLTVKVTDLEEEDTAKVKT